MLKSQRIEIDTFPSKCVLVGLLRMPLVSCRPNIELLILPPLTVVTP